MENNTENNVGMNNGENNGAAEAPDITVTTETTGQKVWKWTKKIGGYVLAGVGGFLAHMAVGNLLSGDNEDSDDSGAESSEG